MAKTKDLSEKAKLKNSIGALKHALSFEKESKKDAFYFSGISKSFESAIEYAIKYLKRRAQDEGLDPYSPREAIKLAGRLGLIENVELWLSFMDTRNLSVHDYLEIEPAEYLKLIKTFYREAVVLAK